MRTTCTYHCAACGSHFHSLVAFDKHRQGDFDKERWCEEPMDVKGLARLTSEGVCELARPKPSGTVTIWTTAGSVERLRELHRKPETDSEAAA